MQEKIKLFGFWRSVAAYRVRTALALKGLEWEEVSVDLLAGEQFAGELAALNPQNAVPVLIDGGPPLTQSLAIIEYLEERYPQTSLFPEEPYARAAARSFALITIADAHPFQVPRVRAHLANTFGADEAAVKSWAQHWQKLAFRAMETRLSNRLVDSAFCFGDQPGIADIALASYVSGALTFDTAIGDYARVSEVYEHCLKLDAFALYSLQALKPDEIE